MYSQQCSPWHFLLSRVQQSPQMARTNRTKIRLASNIPGLILPFREVLLTGTRLKTPSCRIQLAGPSRPRSPREKPSPSSFPPPPRAVHLKWSWVQREKSSTARVFLPLFFEVFIGHIDRRKIEREKKQYECRARRDEESVRNIINVRDVLYFLSAQIW